MTQPRGFRTAYFSGQAVLTGLAALAGLTLAALPAQAQTTLQVQTTLLTTTTINFDGLTVDKNGVAIANGYSGLNWSNFYAINTPIYEANDGAKAPGPNGYDFGTVSRTNIATNGLGSEATASADSLFTLNSGYFTAAWRDNLVLTVTGLNNGTSLFTKTIVLSATMPTFVSLDFAEINQIKFDASGGTKHPDTVDKGYVKGGTNFVLDNLSITRPDPLVSAAPEPSQTVGLALAGLSLAGLLLKARRKAAAA